MEPAQGAKLEMPRQPGPLRIVVSGTHAGDVLAMATRLARYAGNNGDDIQMGAGHHTVAESTKEFVIYPRAVND